MTETVRINLTRGRFHHAPSQQHFTKMSIRPSTSASASASRHTSNPDTASTDRPGSMAQRHGDEGAKGEEPLALTLPAANKRINSLLRSIQSLLRSSIQKPDKEKLNSKIESLIQISCSHGLTCKQACQVLRLASGINPNLASKSNQKHSDDGDDESTLKINTSTSIRLIKLILPRPGEKFNKDFVLLVLGNLSSPPGVLEDAPGGEDHLRQGLKPRRKLDLKVQAACLRHLLLLLSPPSASNLSLLVSSPVTADDSIDASTTTRRPGFSSLHNDEPVQAGPKSMPVPSTFLSPQAKRLLSKSYGVLFHFMEYSTLRPYLCQLLCHLTTRKHVKQYRIAKLLEMMRTLSSEPPLSALISVYSNFYPDMLFPELVGGSSSASSILGGGSGNIQGLKYPDMNWLAKVHWLHAFPEGSGPSLLIETSEEDPNITQDSEPRPSKKIKLSSSISSSRSTGGGSNILPSATTLAFSSDSVIVSEISSMRHFARSLVRLELPSQLASALENQLVRLALFLENEEMERSFKEERISNWLKSKLEDEMGARFPVINPEEDEAREENDEEDDDSFSENARRRLSSSRRVGSFTLPRKSSAGIKRIDQLFRKSHSFFYHEGRLSSGLQNWLYGFLKIWDGQSYLDGICSWIGLVDVRPWKELSKYLLSPLRRIAVSSGTSIHARSQIVRSVSNLLSRWSNVTWQEMRDGSGSTFSSSEEDITELTDKVGDWASELVHLLLRLSPDSVLLQDAMLSLFEVLSTAPTSSDLQSSTLGLHSTSLPTLPLLYITCLSRPGSLMAISRICGVLLSVRITFQKHDQHLSEPDHFQKLERLSAKKKEKLETCFSEEKRKGLNETVSSIANLIWTTKAFNGLEEGSIDIGLEGQIFKDLSNRCDERGDALSSLAAITSGLSFAALAEDAFNTKAERDGLSKSFSAPIGKGSLTEAKKFGLSMPYTELRAYLLSYMAERGAEGLNNLLCASMSSLSRAANQS